MNLRDRIQRDITSKTEKDSVTNVKVGTLLTEILDKQVTRDLTLEIITKGFNAEGIVNESFEIEKGDIVRGWKTDKIYWPEAIFLGGDPTDRDNNYRSGSEVDYTDVLIDMWP